MKLELYKKAVIKTDISKYKLKKGDVVTLVEYFPSVKDRKAGYAVEVFNIHGESIAVLDLLESQLVALPQNALPSIRKIKKIAV